MGTVLPTSTLAHTTPTHTHTCGGKIGKERKTKVATQKCNNSELYVYWICGADTEKYAMC